MVGILDYIGWRGDIGFDVSPFNDVDALILAQLSYVPFDGLLPAGFGQPVSLARAAELFDPDKVPDKLRIITFRDDCELIRRLGSEKRFSSLTVEGFVNNTDAEKNVQFAAITINLPDGRKYISFRGTDDTIVGWKEDFNFSYLCETPSQTLAMRYLKDNFADFDGGLILGGHSKGGNLAVYAAVYCGYEIGSAIEQIYDFDGPGFRSEIADGLAYRRFIPKIRSFIPESSLVGQLLTANVEHSIVRSSAKGIMQHLAYSWAVVRDSLELTNGLSKTGSMINKTMSSWLGSLDDETRRMFVKAVFDVLEAPDFETFTELGKFNLKTTAAILGAIRKLAPVQQKAVLHAFKQLALSGKDAVFSELSESMKDMQQKLPMSAGALGGDPFEKGSSPKPPH
ncbi:Protein of unknown function [Ruminococcus sp. YE71]|uniref:Mbeg1-like protein n=1 Tax=unclassified Ruminococcus TaxID=2608920 RepID=UPI0008908F23|nr:MULTISPECIES: Mbeg1-like protein [unclassified Ruminococcus]SDA17253.1 Protein of unknown function [Ruminococcus sp. YE78]SFW26566.1 Protein of unknown function [Ruminococcus sp. YE71]